MPFPEGGDPERKSESSVYDTPSTFAPYDEQHSTTSSSSPESVQPTSSPAPSSTTPGNVGDTSGADGEPGVTPPQDAEEKAEEPLPEFDKRHAEAFEGVLYLGRLTETVSLFGHKFVIRTLTTEEMAEISLIVKPYEGLPSANAVYQAAVVAAAVVNVDGQPLPGAITVDRTGELTGIKYPYVAKQWMPPVKEAIYNKVFALELKARRALVALGEASG
jgi:hypothetical protein